MMERRGSQFLSQPDCVTVGGTSLPWDPVSLSQWFFMYRNLLESLLNRLLSPIRVSDSAGWGVCKFQVLLVLPIKSHCSRCMLRTDCGKDHLPDSKSPNQTTQANFFKSPNLSNYNDITQDSQQQQYSVNERNPF